MSLNTAHIPGGGVLIYSNECILLYSEHVSLDFNGGHEAFQGSKGGRLYLTTHRMVFINQNQQDKMQSFSFPFVTLKNVEIEQPVFGANYIKGIVRAQPNGNWNGEAKFKLLFKKGGAIEFGQAMLKAVQMVSSHSQFTDVPPPYSPPGATYMAPPPAYTPPPGGYYGWMPPTNVFPDMPAANTVYMTDAPPPYPGINLNTNGVNSYATASAPPPGFTVPQQSQNGNCKEAEAAQSAYYDPNRPQCAYVPPPAYYEPPPAYKSDDKKTQ